LIGESGPLKLGAKGVKILIERAVLNPRQQALVVACDCFKRNHPEQSGEVVPFFTKGDSQRPRRNMSADFRRAARFWLWMDCHFQANQNCIMDTWA